MLINNFALWNSCIHFTIILHIKPIPKISQIPRTHVLCQIPVLAWQKRSIMDDCLTKRMNKESIKTPQQLNKLKLVHISVQFYMQSCTFDVFQMFSYLLSVAHLLHSLCSPCCVEKPCWDQTCGEQHQEALTLTAPDHSSVGLPETEALIPPKKTKKKDEAQALEPETEWVGGVDSRQCCSYVSPVLG